MGLAWVSTANHQLPQVKTKKVETDLLIDQLHEVFHTLSSNKVGQSVGEG